MAGANSIFSSDDHKMLTVTTPCPDYDADKEMLNLLGLEMRPPFQKQEKTPTPATALSCPLFLQAPSVNTVTIFFSIIILNF